MTKDHELPAGWMATTLGEVIDYGKTDKADPDEIPDDAWVLELEDIEKDSSKILQRITFAERKSKSTKNRFERGDVLYGKLRPYLNKIVIADAPGYCTTEIVPLKPTDTVDSRYLFYWLKHPAFLEYAKRVSHGLNMPRLATEAAKKAPFVLAPLAEQKRVADKLDRLLAAVDTCKARLDAIPAILKRFRQSVLKAATSGELANASRPTHNLSGGFPRERVGSLVMEPLRNGKSVRDGTGKAVLRLTAIKDGLIDPRECKTGAWGSIDPSRFFVRPGDFLVARGNGSKDLVGRGGLVAGAIPETAFPDTMIRIRPNNARLDPSYLRLVWDTNVVRAQIENMARTTAGIWKVAQGNLEEIELPVPTIREQQEIVAAVESLLEKVASVRGHCVMATDLSAHLAPMILRFAFAGRLVPQDSGDEPAENLLKRGSQPRVVSVRHKKRTGIPRMSAVTKELLARAILEMPRDRFTFQELRSRLTADYEPLKALLYELLQEPQPIVRQVFDPGLATMQLVRQRS